MKSDRQFTELKNFEPNFYEISPSVTRQAFQIKELKKKYQNEIVNMIKKYKLEKS